VLNDVRSGNYGEYCDDTKEERTNESYSVEDPSDIISGRSSLSDTRDSSALLLKVVCNLHRIEGDLSIEICKCDYKKEEGDRIYNSVCLKDAIYAAPEALSRCGYTAKSKDSRKKRYYRACKDYRHNAGHIELKRKVRALTAVHLTADNLLSILNGNSSLGARNVDYEHNECNDCSDENQRAKR